MAELVQRVFNGETRLGVRLGLEDYTRPLAFGNNWTRLRIGMLLGITLPDAINIWAGTLGIGVCSSTGPCWGDAATRHAVMFTSGNASTGSAYTYTAGAGYPTLTQATSCQLTRRVGNVNTSVTAGGGQPFFHGLGGTLRLTLVIVDLAKNYLGPNIGCAMWSNDASSSGSFMHFDTNSLVDSMELAWFPTVNPNVTAVRMDTGVRQVRVLAVGGALTNTVVWDETVGALDTVDISWNKATYPIEIYGLAVSSFG